MGAPFQPPQQPASKPSHSQASNSAASVLCRAQLTSELTFNLHDRGECGKHHLRINCDAGRPRLPPSLSRDLCDVHPGEGLGRRGDPSNVAFHQVSSEIRAHNHLAVIGLPLDVANSVVKRIMRDRAPRSHILVATMEFFSKIKTRTSRRSKLWMAEWSGHDQYLTSHLGFADTSRRSKLIPPLT
ncbi:hypothetical protein ABIE78_001748 [Sinorhizobium fredii]